MNLILCIIIIILIILLYNCKKNSSYSKYYNIKNIIITLYRQCARWAIASLQDDSVVIKVLHANYAAGYLWSIKDIVTSEDFKKITNEDLLDFENVIVSIQDQANKSLVNTCKDLIYVDEQILQRAIYYKSKEDL